jgi:hypothetical protein
MGVVDSARANGTSAHARTATSTKGPKMQNQANATVNKPATLTVGSNDTVTAAPAKSAGAVFTANYKRIQQLIVEREVWEQGVARTCNDQLYTLLAKCYKLHSEMHGDSDAAKALRKSLSDLISLKAYRFIKGTHTLTKIVKCVFGVDRRRVSAYSLVLREALAQKLDADAIPSFISNAGGVEEIRRSKNASATTPKQKAELGKQAVSSTQLAVISDSNIAEKLDIANVGNDLVAIVTQQADGSLIVRALIHSQSVLNAALACAYTENKGVVQTDSSNAKPANDDQFRTDLINAAAISPSL